MAFKMKGMDHGTGTGSAYTKKTDWKIRLSTSGTKGPLDYAKKVFGLKRKR